MTSPERMGEEAAQSIYASVPPSVSIPASTLLSKVLAERTIGERRDTDSSSSADKKSQRSSLQEFLSSQDDVARLILWFGEEKLRSTSAKWLVEQMDRDIAKIDSLLGDQLNAILHSPEFQQLEASWRGIEYLVHEREQYSDSRIKIKILNVSWADLNKDFEGATEFDQSHFFKKVYEEGMGQAGADPFSVLLADYSIHPRLSPKHRYDDMNILHGLAHVAAAAFCPLITNAHPSMFAVDRFGDLKNGINLPSLHSGLDFFSWQRFRESEDSRFLCLALPHILIRRPYEENCDHGFPFTEKVVRLDDYLWGGAAFGMGEVLMRAFADSGWFANIRGAHRGVLGGGVVTGPAFDRFSTEPFDNVPKPLTDIVLGDDFERDLSNAGFLPLCACKEMPLAAFYSAATAQKPKEYNTVEATMSARLSIMLNYLLCVSRFAHYLKWIARDKIGSCNSPEELQDILQRWITDYVSPDKDATAATRLRKPLLEADIKVRSVPGKAGMYESTFHLVPHHELDDMRVSIRLNTKLLRSTT